MKKNFFFTLFIFISFALNAKKIEILSPDKNIKLLINVSEGVSLEVLMDQKLILEAKNIYLDTDRGVFPAKSPKIVKTKRTTTNQVIIPEIKEKYSKITEKYNELNIEFKDKSSLSFRVYNNGVAYSFTLNLPGTIKINKDNVDLNFEKNASIIFQKDNNPNSSYERPYIVEKIENLKNEEMGNLPALVKSNGANVLLLEAGNKNYPYMWLKKSNKGLTSYYWGFPDTYNTKGNFYNRKNTRTNKNYIAETDASRSFPWKVFAIALKDTDLLKNQLVYLLGEKCKIDNPSWIKPGWVTFDWWARHGIYGVDFKAGINDATAKYMIDFAADFGIRYFLFDDGWTYNEDLTKTIDGLNMEEIVKYAKSKNIDVMLWVAHSLFDEQMETALKQFEKWGIKGIKIDFMNRSDQEIIDFYWRAAEQSAKYKMVINFHGAYPPDGLRRAYPNVLTREALIEFEYNGVSDWDNPTHHCMLPFIRNVAGPMDYIPGTMNNATKSDFRTNGNTPMGQGTRAHSMAMAVIVESPMQMLPDAQSDYYREKECTKFLTKIPVEWDEIVPMDGKIGEYIALARKKGNSWHVGAITNWTARDMNLVFDFLDEGKEYTIEIFKDGINADIRAIDYKREIRNIKKGDILPVSMSSGGGWVARIDYK